MNRPRMVVAILMASMGLARATCGESPKSETPKETKADADRDAYARNLMARIRMPGLQTVVVKNGHVVWSRSYGYAVVEPPGPETAMTPATILLMGSVSKTLVGAATLKAIEEGRMSLDDDINGSLPFRVRNPRWADVPITWKMLLTHTSSIRDDDEAQQSTYTFGVDSPTALSEYLRGVFVPGGTSQRMIKFGEEAPGTKRVYCNYCYDLVALALEDLVGQPFHEYVKRVILDPLHMADTGYFLSALPAGRLAVNYGCNTGAASKTVCVPARVVFGHQPPADSVLAQQVSYPDYPCGRLHTSALEYAKFMSMIMNGGVFDGVRVLKASSVDRMLTSAGVRNLEGWEQGLAFLSPKDLHGRRVWGHDGEDFGVATAAFFDRRTGVGAIAFGNANVDDYSLTAAMTELTLRLMASFQ